MKLRFRDIVSKMQIEDDAGPDAPERCTPRLPKRKHSDYPPPKVYAWQPSDWIKPPDQERLRGRR